MHLNDHSTLLSLPSLPPLLQVKLPPGCEEMVIDVYRIKKKKGAKGGSETAENPMERFSGSSLPPSLPFFILFLLLHSPFYSVEALIPPSLPPSLPPSPLGDWETNFRQGSKWSVPTTSTG